MRYAGLRVEWRLERGGIGTNKTASYNGNKGTLLNDINTKIQLLIPMEILLLKAAYDNFEMTADTRISREKILHFRKC
jgi:hypothetical protein